MSFDAVPEAVERVATDVIRALISTNRTRTRVSRPRELQGNSNPSWRSFLEARSSKAFAISAIPPGVGEDRGGGGANDESPSEQSPGANGLASDCPRPHRVQDRFEQQEQRDLERRQVSNRAAQTDVPQSDLEDTQIDERHPLAHWSGRQWQRERNCDKTRERVAGNHGSDGGVAFPVGTTDFAECQQRQRPREPRGR